MKNVYTHFGIAFKKAQIWFIGIKEEPENAREIERLFREIRTRNFLNLEGNTNIQVKEDLRSQISFSSPGLLQNMLNFSKIKFYGGFSRYKIK